MPYAFTPRLGLTKPDPNDDYDIEFHNDSMDILDNIGGVVICNTAGRPATPYLWQTIYDTDEHAQFSWDGDSWEQVTLDAPVPITELTMAANSGARPSSPTDGRLIYRKDIHQPEIYNNANTAWEPFAPGVMGGKLYTTAATLATVSTTETKIMETGSISLPGGRLFRVRCMLECGVATANANLVVRFRVGTTSGSLLAEYRTVSIPVANRRSHFLFEHYFTTAGTGSVNIICDILRGDGSGNVMAYGSSATPFMIMEYCGRDSGGGLTTV